MTARACCIVQQNGPQPFPVLEEQGTHRILLERLTGIQNLDQPVAAVEQQRSQPPAQYRVGDITVQ